MQNLKIGLLQFNQAWEDKSQNYERILRLMKEGEEIDLLLLPEMFHTSFTMNTELAEPMGNSNGIDFLKTISTTFDCAIYTSLIISENGKIFNRGLFIHPAGEITFYNKRKTFGLAGEDNVYTAGESQVIVDYKNWKINLQICYDLRFPELVANRIELDGNPTYDIILYVANWPEKRANHWDALLKARAIENQAVVLSCNRVGIDFNKQSYIGGSCGIGPLGELLSKSSKDEGLILFQIQKTELNEVRKQLPFLKDR
ncbi:nitrilase family protein [Crocinitomicaceae bacterium]|nr:nitrilase family protein [Crocinitomicaceae bacterium]